MDGGHEYVDGLVSGVGSEKPVGQKVGGFMVHSQLVLRPPLNAVVQCPDLSLGRRSLAPRTFCPVPQVEASKDAEGGGASLYSVQTLLGKRDDTCTGALA